MILKPGFMLLLTVAALKADGTPGHIDGAINWESSDESVIKLTPAPLNGDPNQGDDPMAMYARVVGPGQATVRATADIDIGDGVDNVFGEIDINVPNEDVATFVINAGTPVPDSGA